MLDRGFNDEVIDLMALFKRRNHITMLTWSGQELDIEFEDCLKSVITSKF